MKIPPFVIIPSDIKPVPEQHEIEIAGVLAQYFHQPVEFIIPSKGYKMKSADVIIGGISWELKSPTGASRKTTVEYQFKGLRQSRYLVIDGRRTKLSDEYILKQIALEIPKHPRANKVLFITKQANVIDCK